MTHPGKNPGMTGFPTPNEIPLDEAYLVFKFPNDEAIAQLILGALIPLAFSYNFYMWGDITPEEISLLFDEIITQAPYNLLEGSKVPTPFWDENSEVDDEAPKDDQPWYGYVENPTAPADELTFIENAAIWGITGFLAFATWEVGFAPAIFFHELAPRFVLAFNRGDVGEVIRVIIDSVEYTRVDTSSASPGDVIRVSVVTEEDEDGHDLMIVQESTE